MVEVYFNLDFSVIKEQYINVSQYDNESRIIRIALYNNGQRINIPENYHIRIKMKKPDGNYILNDCEIDTVHNQAIFEITQQETSAYGNCLAELILTDDTEEIIHTMNFILKVKKSVYQSEEIESTSEYQSFEKALIRADSWENRIENLEKKIEELGGGGNMSDNTDVFESLYVNFSPTVTVTAEEVVE